MRRLLPWAAVVLAGLLTVAVVAVERGDQDDDRSAMGESEETPCERCRVLTRVVNCGHRGSGVSRVDSPYPENTLPSFHRAVQAGASMIELDVTLTSDDELVVFHDDRLERTTDGEGCVANYPLAWLKSLNAAVGTSAEAERIEMPTLDEVMASTAADLNIEIKVHENPACPASDRAELARAVVDRIEADPQKRNVVVSSFDPEVLLRVEAVAGGLETALVSEDPRALNVVAQTAIDAAHLHMQAITPDLVVQARAMHLPIRVWTVNDPLAMIALARLGVDAIITDEPDVLGHLRQAACNEARQAKCE